jgi:hypothetical protein
MKDSKAGLQKRKVDQAFSLICSCSNLNLISNALTSESISNSNLTFP